MAGKKKYELEIMISGGTNASLSASIQRAKREISSLERQAGLSAKAVGDSFGGMSVKGIDTLGKISDQVFGAIAKGSKVAAAGVAGLIGASTMVGMGFEQQMSTVQAISQASAADMEKLNALAKKMGETTQFTAEEAGQGLEYMAMAGWKTQDMLKGLPGIMNLAAASGEDLGRVSDIVTDAMTAFGMAADESDRFADVLAQASSSSNTNVAMMGETFKYVAPVAGSLGYTIEEVALAAGLMANTGIKAEQAGTAMRTMFTNLAKPTKQMQGYMDALSLSLVDEKGEMKSLSQLLNDLRAGFSNLTEAEQAEYAAGIAGKEGMSGLLAIVNTSEDDFKKLTEEINNSAGAAEAMSKMRLDNLKGDLTLLSSAAQGVGIELYEGFSDDMREAAQYAVAWVSSFTDRLEEDIPTARRLMKNFGKWLEEFFGPVMDIGKWLAKNPQAIEGGIAGIASALLTFKAVKAAKNGVKLLSSLSGIVSAWPVAAAGLAIGAIVGITTAIQEAERKAAQQSLAEHFGDITLSLKDLEEAARNTLGEGLFQSIDELSEAGEKTSKIYDSMQSGIREINKAGWKLSLGIKFDESDTQSYVSAVDQYVKDAQEYITSRGYELKLAVGIVMGEEGDGLLENSDAFYQSLYNQLEPLKQGLQETLQDITENGLTLDKDKIVRDYLDEISEVTAMISDAQSAAKLQMIQDDFSGAALTPETFQNYQDALNEYAKEAIESIDSSSEQILASLNAQRMLGEQGKDGGISQEEFEAQSEAVRQKRYARKAQVLNGVYQATRDTVMDTYGGDIAPALEAVNKSLDESLNGLKTKGLYAPEDWGNAAQIAVLDAASQNHMSKANKDAIGELLKGMEPNQEQMQLLIEQYKKAGGDLNDAMVQGVLESMDEADALGAVSGNEDSLWSLLGKKAADDPVMATAILASKEAGAKYGDSCIEEIKRKRPEAVQEAENFLSAVRARLEQGIVPVTVPLPVNLQAVEAYSRGVDISGKTDSPENRARGYKNGGIVNSRQFAEVAEEGPEAIIPIEHSGRALELWRETGRLLGAYEEHNYDRMYEGLTAGTIVENNSSSSFAPVCNLTINVPGGESVRSQITAGASEGFDRFIEYMERYKREQYRAAF